MTFHDLKLPGMSRLLQVNRSSRKFAFEEPMANTAGSLHGVCRCAGTERLSPGTRQPTTSKTANGPRSELIESERRFREAQMELAHASRVVTMGQFTASIAHEVNQPLAALLTNAETALRWLAHQPPNLEKAKPSIERVINDGKRAADIVSRIRDFSKKAPVRKERLEVNEAILELWD